MSAIKLPVKAYQGHFNLWYVHDSNGIRLCQDLQEQQASQIAISINLHDELVAALVRRVVEIGQHSRACKCMDCEILRKATP